MVLADVDPATDVLADLARLHYDLAGFALPRQLDALPALTTARSPALRQRLPVHPRRRRRDPGRAAPRLGDPPGSLLDWLAANTRRLFPDTRWIRSRLMATDVILNRDRSPTVVQTGLRATRNTD